jgi:hypothetical protein
MMYHFHPSFPSQLSFSMFRFLPRWIYEIHNIIMSFRLLDLAWVSLMFRSVFADESLFPAVDDPFAAPFLEPGYLELGPVSNDPFITALTNEQEFGSVLEFPELGSESGYLGFSFPSTHSEDLLGSNYPEDLFGSDNPQGLFGPNSPEDLFVPNRPEDLFGSNSPEDLFGSNSPEYPFVPDPTLITAIDDLGAQTPFWADQGGLAEVTPYDCAHIGDLHTRVCASGNPSDNTAYESLPGSYSKLEFSILSKLCILPAPTVSPSAPYHQ